MVKNGFFPPTIYIMSKKYSVHCEIEPLAEHAECDLGWSMATSDGESNSIAALCTGKKEKEDALVQTRNDHLLSQILFSQGLVGL